MRWAFPLLVMALAIRPALAQTCPDGTPPPCAARQPGLRLPSLAVLFMEPRSLNPDDSLLTEGLTLEIISTLGGVQRLDVRSRWVSRRIAADRDPLRSARALGVDYIVDGVLEVDSGRVLVRGTLTRTATGRVVRPLRIEHSRADLGRLEEELATEVAGAVVGQLLPAERARFAARREDPRMAGLLLRALPLMDQFTAAGLRQAILLLRQAIGMDSTSSRAWSDLGFCYALLRNLEPDSFLVYSTRTTMAWQRALALDSVNGVARAGLAFMRAMANDLSPTTEAMARRGALLEPSFYTRDLLAFVLMYRGHLDEGASVVRELARSDSLSPLAWDAVALWMAEVRRFGEAARAWERALALRPSHGDSVGVTWARRWARLESGDCAGALAAGRAANDPLLTIEALHCLGRPAKADSLIDGQLALATVSPDARAIYLAWRSQPDSAFAILDRGFAHFLALTMQHPAFDPYRQHPGYLALRRRMGLDR